MRLHEVPVYRQRLTLEAIFDELPTTEKFVNFLYELSDVLEMTPCADPYILDVDLPGEDGKGQHIHLNWTTSGVSIYTWHKYNFATLEIYTCKEFNANIAEALFSSWLRPKEYTRL